ncbi:hypothetical protein M422DRAFT_249152 [Sphaerobolus stellatus SS14]|uniref:Uncharacterized protein n=1 Tax=Sphaerobolus stellatus (strain SS14) TaxID=990650 RepID=A0A0C9UP73_SPHS4|nr:hypothetical protein M422DRAFT_271563 [Sphaerobolus stellatus SS14]KIJ47307.1 hypothetical protein M422DRAFT_249152 [Sphaerobolus stellatus SS14]
MKLDFAGVDDKYLCVMEEKIMLEQELIAKAELEEDLHCTKDDLRNANKDISFLKRRLEQAESAIAILQAPEPIFESSCLHSSQPSFNDILLPALPPIHPDITKRLPPLPAPDVDLPTHIKPRPQPGWSVSFSYTGFSNSINSTLPTGSRPKRMIMVLGSQIRTSLNNFPKIRTGTTADSSMPVAISAVNAMSGPSEGTGVTVRKAENVSGDADRCSSPAVIVYVIDTGDLGTILVH